MTDWKAVLAILLQNKVPLLGLEHDPALADSPLAQMPEFQRAAAGHEARWRGFRDEYELVRNRLLDRDIRGILFKSAGVAPSFPFTSDNLDFLVKPEYIEQGREVLLDLGYVELRNVEEPLKLLFRKFDGGESVSAIHLHGTVGWGVPFMDDDALWRRIRESADDPLVLVPGPEDALLVNIAHAFYEDKSLKLLDLVRIRHCLRAADIDYDDVERIARERGWVDGLAFCLLLFDRIEELAYGERSLPPEVSERARGIVSRDRWLARRLERTLEREEVRFPFYVSFLFGKTVYYRKILHDSRRRPLTRMGDVFRTLVWGAKLKLGIRGQRGMIVSFSGIDGSGKTAHIEPLKRAFKTCDIITRIHWSRFGSSAGTPAAPGGPDPSATSDTATSYARRRRRLANPALRIGWLLFNMLKYVFGCLIQVRIPKALGKVVICDRYYHDAAVEIGASLPGNRWLARQAERILRSLCPRPGIAWLLDVPAAVSVERQPDERRSGKAREELERQREAYRAMAPLHNLRTVETDRGLQDTTNRVVRETLRIYYHDYHTWTNALLLSNPDQMNPPGGTR